MIVHDPIAVILAVASIVAVLGAVTVLICACVCGARDDRLAQAWHEERERATVALNKGWQDP